MYFNSLPHQTNIKHHAMRASTNSLLRDWLSCSDTDLIQHAQERFSITLPVAKKLPLTFVHLNEHSHFLAPASRFSLLMESLGTMRLAYKAIKMSSSMPHIFVDTTGYAFTFVVARVLFGCKVLAYVHYPTISTDMLNLVWERRRSAYNHQEYISNSRITTYVKLVYYTVFAVMYGMVGSLSSLALVNSTWTYNHIQSLWKGAAWLKRIQIVFPPCSVTDFQKNDITKKRESVILSIGQFRPEKDHALQIESMSRLFELHPELKKEAKLVLIGSCRGASDQARLEQLQDLTKKLDLTASVSFVVNQPYSVIQDWLKKASVGIHTVRSDGLLGIVFPIRACGLTLNWSLFFVVVRCGTSTLELELWR
jgi:alpha-1,2-mannosyltransferase